MTPFDEVMLKENHDKGKVCQCALYDFDHSIVDVSAEDLSNPGNRLILDVRSRITSLKV